jgi:hypothetical protein
MKKPVIITLCTLALIIASLAWWFSDTQVVKRQTKQFAKVLTIASNDAKSTRAQKNQNFTSLLAKSVSCHVNTANYQSDFHHDDLVSAHHMMVHSCQSSSATPSNLQISKPENNQATVTADLDLSVTEKDGTRHSDPCQATLVWQKNDQGKWKLSSIEIKAE